MSKSDITRSFDRFTRDMLHLFWMTAIVTFILGLIFGAVGHAVLQPVFKMAQHE